MKELSYTISYHFIDGLSQESVLLIKISSSIYINPCMYPSIVNHFNVLITVKCDASNLQKYYEIYSLVIWSFKIQKLLNADIMNLTFLFLVSYFTYAVYNILLTM